MLLEAALNGGRPTSEHRDIPVSAIQLAAATVEAAAAGAGAVHFHVRDGDGRETLAAAWVARAVAEVRKHGVPCGVSTGAWIIPDPRQRLAAVHEWTVLPDFVSINFDEEGAAELASHFLGRNVGIEAGVANPFAAERLVASGLGNRCLRVMFEPREQVADEAMAVVGRTEAVLDAGKVRVSRLLHGVNATAWPLIDEAGSRRYDTRIGFEDTLTLPGGELAGGNGELVRAARERLAGRDG
ncbi:MAG TPA: 3-keto-5-aminohexanoate cleavage protein [Gemmatimonadales bacterium]|jgi:uncharacterized protein (DUF849 family)